MRSLVSRIEAKVPGPGDHRHPGGIYPLRNLYRFANLIEKLLTGRLIARHKGRLPPTNRMRNKDAHLHVVLLQGVGNAGLLRRRASPESVVFKRRKPLLGHERNLVDGIGSGMSVEKSEVRGVV